MRVDLVRLVLAAAIAFGAGYPLGWMRGGVRPRLRILPAFSRDWWKALAETLFYVGLALPVAWFARRQGRLDPWTVWGPVLLLAVLFAQAVGERIRYRKRPPPPEYLRKRNG